VEGWRALNVATPLKGSSPPGAPYYAARLEPCGVFQGFAKKVYPRRGIFAYPLHYAGHGILQGWAILAVGIPAHSQPVHVYTLFEDHPR